MNTIRRMSALPLLVGIVASCATNTMQNCIQPPFRGNILIDQRSLRTVIVSLEELPRNYSDERELSDEFRSMIESVYAEIGHNEIAMYMLMAGIACYHDHECITQAVEAHLIIRVYAAYLRRSGEDDALMLSQPTRERIQIGLGDDSDTVYAALRRVGLN